MQQFSERLRALRATRGLSQPQLAAAVSIGQRTISAYENGSSEPTASGIRRLAEYFGCTADHLVGLSTSPRPVPPGYWIVDLDIVDKVRAGQRIPPGHTRGCAVPERYDVMPSAEYAALVAELDGDTKQRRRRRKE